MKLFQNFRAEILGDWLRSSWRFSIKQINLYISMTPTTTDINYFVFQHQVVSYGEYDCIDVKCANNRAVSSEMFAILLPIALSVLVNYY